MTRRPGAPRAWRRAPHVPTGRAVEPWTAGVRREHRRVTTGDDGRTPEESFRRRAWVWFRRDPVTGELPFGVW